MTCTFELSVRAKSAGRCSQDQGLTYECPAVVIGLYIGFEVFVFWADVHVCLEICTGVHTLDRLFVCLLACRCIHEVTC